MPETCGCDGELRAMFADDGVEVVVEPYAGQVLAPGWVPFNPTCRHGWRWHARPSPAQVARWHEAGVA